MLPLHATLPEPRETLLQSISGCDAVELNTSPSTPSMVISVHGASPEHCRLASTLVETVPVMFDHVMFDNWKVEVSQFVGEGPAKKVHWFMDATLSRMFVTVKSRKTGPERKQ